jgi:hypothetical protein
MEQEETQAALLSKIQEDRQQKLANMSPEIQQILQALEALLQSGQISEQEAMMVLEELGLSGGGEAPAEQAEQPPVPAEGEAQ